MDSSKIKKVAKYIKISDRPWQDIYIDTWD